MVLRALLREADGLVPTPLRGGTRAEAEYHLRRLGRRRTAYPLDMSLEQLHNAGLTIAARLGRYHERGAPRSAGRKPVTLDDVARCLEDGKSVLLLGEPGAGKTLAMYQLAVTCARTGLMPVPVRAREADDVLARDGWRDIRTAGTDRVVMLVDSLDEAADVIAQDPARFAGRLGELLSVGPYVVSSRIRDFEELVSEGFPDPGFDVVYVLEPWTLEADFREYLSRLEAAGLLDDPALYEAVVASGDLTRLVSRPLYARMLTFVGEQAARGMRDHHALYGEYLTRLARVADQALDLQGHHEGGALGLWQSAAWIIYSSGAQADDPVPLGDVERMLPSPLPRPVVRRVLDQVIERGTWHGRDAGEFIHYSFYEYLVAREAYDRIVRDPSPAGIADLLKRDLPREVRHYLIGQLTAGDASLRDSLRRSYQAVRHILDLPEGDRLSACNLIIYLISRVDDGCAGWLRRQFADEQVLFLRHALLWAMCHTGSGWALREFFAALEADAALRSECRGYTLYYYGDLPRNAGPPYLDDDPAATACPLTFRRVLALFAREDYSSSVAPERRYIDLYTFLDILGTRGIGVSSADAGIIRKAAEDLRPAGLPASLLARLAQVASGAGIPGQQPAPRHRDDTGSLGTR